MLRSWLQFLPHFLSIHLLLKVVDPCAHLLPHVDHVL